ncbi:hypothetical protein FRC01_011070, partial [Tulasnella sp. 417]
MHRKKIAGRFKGRAESGPNDFAKIKGPVLKAVKRQRDIRLSPLLQDLVPPTPSSVANPGYHVHGLKTLPTLSLESFQLGYFSSAVAKRKASIYRGSPMSFVETVSKP